MIDPVLKVVLGEEDSGLSLLQLVERERNAPKFKFPTEKQELNFIEKLRIEGQYGISLSSEQETAIAGPTFLSKRAKSAAARVEHVDGWTREYAADGSLTRAFRDGVDLDSACAGCCK